MPNEVSSLLEIEVESAGLLTTIQDLGRVGYAHLGFSPCGAADAVAARIANRLVGNPDSAPLLEISLFGPTLNFSGNATVALTGSVECSLNGHALPTWQSVEVPAGSVLRLGPTRCTARCYMAVAGRFAADPVLHSYSVDLVGGIGGTQGRALRADDTLTWQAEHRSTAHRANPEILACLYRRGPLRVTAGQHRGIFSAKAVEQFFRSEWIVTSESNRAGLRLKGAPLAIESHGRLLTEGVPLGAIQVPGSGQPVMLFVDQQTTGGYPIIATLISADLHRVGQLLPNERISFAEISIAEAVDERRQLESLLNQVLE